MKARTVIEGMLAPFRALDLTDEQGMFCGKLLGDLGADVIKIERPGGDRARMTGPFFHDEADPEKSLLWWALNNNKRGITLDIESSEGIDCLRELVKTADLLIESFPVGYMGALGLSYPELEKVNPRIIAVSISPFGQTGPYSRYKGSDMIAWAMSGVQYSYGDADRSPVRIGHPCQAALFASVEATIGALLALYHRNTTGVGQHVDVSTRDSLLRLSMPAWGTWLATKRLVWRGSTPMPFKMRTIWACRDGYVFWRWYFGSRAKRWHSPLIEWMDSEGMASDFIKGIDWDTFDPRAISQEVIDRIEIPTASFFALHTKSELFDGAIKLGLQLGPISTVADLANDAQLRAREFWTEVPHPELGAMVTYPGPFCKTTEASPIIRRRAPRLGEHKAAVFAELADAGGGPKLPTGSKGEATFGSILQGIRIADFSTSAAGPIATSLLASYGAEVIKIEGRNHIDFLRVAGGGGAFVDGIVGVERGTAFLTCNGGKLSLALNLGHPKAVQTARQIIAHCDIVHENFKGGTMEKLGLGYDELKKIKPDIIVIASCLMGHTGPHREFAGLGYMASGMAGFHNIAGWPDRAPTDYGPHTDMIASPFDAVAILAAIEYRRRTGKGMYIDMSQLETAVHFMEPLLLDYRVNGRVADRVGNRHDYAAPHNAYPCLGDDRWCAIAIFTDDEWRSLCDVMRKPELADDPRFGTLAARKANEDELNQIVAGWTADHRAEDVMNRCQAAKVPAGVLLDSEDLLEHDPQIKHRRYFEEVDHPEVGRYRIPTSPFLLSKSPRQVRRPPLLGEDSERILSELLGLSAEDIAQLVMAGAVE